MDFNTQSTQDTEGGNLDFNADQETYTGNDGGDLDFYPGPEVTPRPKTVVEARAMRAHYALGKESPGLDSLNDQLTTDEGEANLRVEVAQNQDKKARAQQDEIVREGATRVAGKATTDQVNLLRSINSLKIQYDPETVLEKMFASKYSSDVLGDNTSPNSPTVQATPAQLNAASDALYDTSSKLALIHNLQEKVTKAKADQSWLGFGVDIAESAFVPGLSEYRLYFPDEQGIIGSATNLDERGQRFWSLPVDEAAAMATRDLDYLLSHNLNDAALYVKNLMGLARSEQVAHNISSLLDAATLGTPVAKIAGAKLANVVKGGISGISEDPIRLKTVYSATGNVGKAAEAGVLEAKPSTVLAAKDPLLHGTDLSEDLPLMMNPSSVVKLNPNALATEAQQRLVAALERSGKLGAQIAFNQRRIDRLPPEAIQVALQEAKRDVSVEYVLPSDAIINMDLVPAETNAGNVNFLKVIIGKRDGTLFKSEAAANTYAEKEYGFNLERYTTGKEEPPKPATTEAPVGETKITVNGKTFTGPDAAKQAREAAGLGHNGGPPLEEGINNEPPVGVKQQGNGWYIQITKPLSEVNPLTREAVAIPTNNRNSESLPNMFLGLIRGARETLGEFQTANRATVTVVPNQTRRLLLEMVKPIGKLKKGSYNQLMNVLEADQAFVNRSATEPTRGRRFHSQGALEQEWRSLNGRLPTEKESLAYWTYHQIMETELAVRDLNMYRDLSRLGVEHWMIPIYNEQGVPEMSQPFYGIFQRTLPWNDKQNWRVLVQDGPEFKFYYRTMGEEQKKHLEKLIEDGARVIQIPNPTDRPLRDITGEGRLVNYVISRELDSKPLPMRLVDKNEGVHVIYPQRFKAVQPKIQQVEMGKYDHFGDQTVSLHYREKDAKASAQVHETVRQMLVNQKPKAEISKYIEDHINMDPDALLKEFEKGGRYDPDIPFVATHMNVSGIEYGQNSKQFLKFTTGPNKMEDHTKSPLNLFGQVDTSFLMDRDLPARQGRIIKSGDSPVIRLEPADTINPMAALQKGMANAIRGMQMNDMKASSIEQWIAQNAYLLQDEDLAQRNPLYAFYNMAFKKEASRDAVLNATWTRQRIRQFIGQQTELGKTVRWTEEKLFNMMPYGTAKWFAVHDYPLIRDPVSYIRSAMLHSIFGMFNPLQYFVQIQALAHTTFVAGVRNGIPGVTAAVLQRMGLQFTENPAIIRHYANVAAKMGFGKPEWFEESYRFLKAFGGDIVANDYALRSDMADPKLFRNKFRKWVLDPGLFPFTEAERTVKSGAFNTAYLEWRRANPEAILDRSVEQKLVNRAMTLYNNMTRAGNSAAEESIVSPMLQFTTWNRRLIDQMWGHELTAAEKARAFIGHSILYGIPMGVGLGVPLATYDRFTKYGMERGWDMTDTKMRLMRDGLLGYLSSLALGKDYDFSRRWGPTNMQIVEDFLFSDKHPLTLLSGPLGSFMMSFWKASFPFIANGYLGMTGGQMNYQITKDDILDVTKQATIGSNLWKDYYMINFHKFYSKNERLLATDANWRDAMMLTLFGVERQEWRDWSLWEGHSRDVKEAHDNAKKQAILEYNRYYRALADDNMNEAEKHFTNAKIWAEVFGDLTDVEIVDTIRQSREGLLEGQYEKAKRNYAIHGNKKTQPARMQRLFDM